MGFFLGYVFSQIRTDNVENIERKSLNIWQRWRMSMSLAQDNVKLSYHVDSHLVTRDHFEVIKGELNPKIKFVLFERTLKITE